MIEKSFFGLMDSLGPFEKKPELAVGVSGGVDSMFLCYLSNKWIQMKRGKLTALVVDHGLRQNSKIECKQVQQFLNKKKISNHYFKWNPKKSFKIGSQRDAREYRYKIIEDWCYKKNILHLLIAHHFDDQKETFFIRLNSNSNAYGLSCMSKITFKKNIRLLRPLLEFNKSKIKSYLIKEKISWIEDQTNFTDKYTRNRYRKIMPYVEQYGLTDNKFKKIFQHANKEKKLLENKVLDWLIKNIEINPLGYAIISTKNFSLLSQKEFIFIFSRILMTISGKIYPPKSKNIITLYKRIKSNKNNLGMNIGGCHIFSDKKITYKVFVSREIMKRNRKQKLNLETKKIFWDNRFEIAGKYKQILYFLRELDKSIFLDQLKLDGWKQLCLQNKEFKKNNKIPIKCILSLPVIKNKAMNLISIPNLKYYSSFENKKNFSDIYFNFKPNISLSHFN